MNKPISKQIVPIFTVLLALALLLSACGQAGAGSFVSPAAAKERPSVSYTLVTSTVDGQMAYVGQGGEIDGLTNPDLPARPGNLVEITLINGDGNAHDIAIPGLEVKSETINQKGSSTTIQFKVSQDALYKYTSSLSGHGGAGMEGRVVVGNSTANAAPAEPASSSNSGSAQQPASTPAAAQEASAEAVSIVQDPTNLPGPIGERQPEHLQIEMEAVELDGILADGATYTYWTFDERVPGPFLRVRVGDTVELTLKNREDSLMTHSIDLHAVTGPGGGAAVTQVLPGEEKSFTFKALNPGLYVYHCATPMVAHHMASGMYGLILVEPEGGLPPVDREFYVMQGEIYTTGNLRAAGHHDISIEKLMNESPDYVVLNGAVGALTEEFPLLAEVGETVRIFYGVGGPNLTSSFHVIGEIFDRVYDQASLTSVPLTDVQTTLVPAGGATVVEFGLEVPGRYLLVDHALSRLERGLVGFLEAEGPDNPEVFQSDEPADGSH
jgi:nitrite reductase (NO-forming)